MMRYLPIVAAWLMVCASALAAPTVYTRTVKPSGGNYTSLANWEDGEDNTGDLVASNRIHVCSIEGTWSAADTSSPNIDGWTTDATRYIEINVASASRHAGVWSTSHYILTNAQGNTLYINEDYTRVIGLQVADGGLGNSSAIRVDGAGCLVDRCLLKTTAVSPSGFQIGVQVVGHGTVLQNIMAYGFTNGGFSSGFFLQANCSVINCTAYKCYIGYYHFNSTVNLTNCLAQNITDDAFAALYGDYNCADTETGPGTHSVQGDVAFVNETFSTLDLHLAWNDTVARMKGIDFSAMFTWDIDGVTRPTLWDIGADNTTNDVVVASRKLLLRGWRR